MGWTNNNEYQCQCSPGNLESWQAYTGNTTFVFSAFWFIPLNLWWQEWGWIKSVSLLLIYFCAGCLDRDECSIDYFSNEYCGSNTECANTMGSFSCECQLGHGAWVPGQGCCSTDMDSSCASEHEGTCHLSADQGILNSHSLDQSLYSNGVNFHWQIRLIKWKMSSKYLLGYSGSQMEKSLSWHLQNLM